MSQSNTELSSTVARYFVVLSRCRTDTKLNDTFRYFCLRNIRLFQKKYNGLFFVEMFSKL